jgi:uncharacterized protein (DUF2267 family)
MQFDQFLVDARDFAGLATTNMAWNMVVGVLHTFRRRLTIKQALQFACVLPPVLRALFIEDWNLEEPTAPFASPEVLLQEVRSVRQAHNFAPDNAIAAVASALRKRVDLPTFERVVSALPEEARYFWSGTQGSLTQGSAGAD